MFYPFPSFPFLTLKFPLLSLFVHFYLIICMFQSPPFFSFLSLNLISLSFSVYHSLSLYSHKSFPSLFNFSPFSSFPFYLFYFIIPLSFLSLILSHHSPLLPIFNPFLSLTLLSFFDHSISFLCLSFSLLSCSPSSLCLYPIYYLSFL